MAAYAQHGRATASCTLALPKVCLSASLLGMLSPYILSGSWPGPYVKADHHFLLHAGGTLLALL